MIDELIKRVFKARDAAHLAHLKTNSYSQHAALESFYNDVIGCLDSYVEAHHGIVGVKSSDQKEIVEELNKDVVWLTENRDAVSKNIPPLENLFDELTAVYLKTLYKLENLR